MARRLTLLLVLAALFAPALARADDAPVVREAVDTLIMGWQHRLVQPPIERKRDAAKVTSAPAGTFERGPEQPIGRMVVQVPLLSF